VTTPPPAAVVSSTPPAATQGRTVVKRSQPATTKGKAEPRKKTQPGRPKVDQPTQSTAAPALRASTQGSSPDTLLLAGGLALVVLVIADTLLLARSRRWLRV
jgi:hypothetical protein